MEYKEINRRGIGVALNCTSWSFETLIFNQGGKIIESGYIEHLDFDGKGEMPDAPDYMDYFRTQKKNIASDIKADEVDHIVIKFKGEYIPKGDYSKQKTCIRYFDIF